MCFAGVQGQAVWQELLGLEDPHLKCLFGTVLNSKAPSTTKKYVYAFNCWRKWAQSSSNISVFPVKPVHLALYLQNLGDTKQSRAAMEEATYSVAWVHQIAGLPSPSSNPSHTVRSSSPISTASCQKRTCYPWYVGGYGYSMWSKS